MGLLRKVVAGVATTAVVADTATVVRNRVTRRQAIRWQQKADARAYELQQAAPPPPQYQRPPRPDAAPTAAPGMVYELQRPGSLKEHGLLTESEFNAAENKLLGI